MAPKDEVDKEVSHTFQFDMLEEQESTVPIPPIFETNAESEENKYGHPRFYEIIDGLKSLHSEKNHDYAAGGDPLGNFRRVSQILALYPNLKLSNPTIVALVYALKQLDAALWMLSNGHSAKVEGIAGRLKDVAVYSILQMILNEEEK